MSGDRDDLARLLYLAAGHPQDFVRCACAARALELRGVAVTAATVARSARVQDRELADDAAAWLTETRLLTYRDADGHDRVADGPHAARRHVMAAVTEGLLDLGPWGLHRAYVPDWEPSLA